MRSSCPRKCLSCKESFLPSPNNRRTQRYCAKAPCRQASRSAARRKWLRKPENRSYFRGPENVERVRRWRKAHPGYCRKRKSSVQDALQDLAPAQVARVEPVAVHGQGAPSRDCSAGGGLRGSDPLALQDLASIQVPLLAGLISLLAGDALQDRFAVFARDLVDRGHRALGREPELASSGASH